MPKICFPTDAVALKPTIFGPRRWLRTSLHHVVTVTPTAWRRSACLWRASALRRASTPARSLATRCERKWIMSPWMSARRSCRGSAGPARAAR
eukprot:3799549-Alexandrium_andersonii.AAC.1